MKICIVTCIHNRDDITKLFLEHITRLKRFFKMHKDIEIVAVAAVSNCELEPSYLDKHLEVWFPFENRPLGYKFNAAIGATAELEWDVLMLLGSDSLISARGIVTAINRIKQGDKMIAFRDMGVVDLQDRSVYGWRPIVVPDKPYEMIPDAVIGAWVKKGRTIGSGRMISREIVEDMGYHLYDHNKDVGLDGSMEKNIYATTGYTFETLDRGQNAHSWALLELKSTYSIHTIDQLLAGGKCIKLDGNVDVQRGFGIGMWNELRRYWEDDMEGVENAIEDYLGEPLTIQSTNSNGPYIKPDRFKVAIITAMWQRPEVFKIFGYMTNELIKDVGEVDFKVFCVGSEGNKSRKLAEGFGFNYIEFPNDHLGKKWNAAVKASMWFGPDYCMMMGSDDIMDAKLFRRYLPYMSNGIDLIGTLDWYFYDIETRSSLYWKGYRMRYNRGHTCGPGRFLSLNLIQAMGWEPWENSGRHSEGQLDTSMRNKLSNIEHSSASFFIGNEGGIGLDIKSAANITRFADWDNTERIPNDRIFKHFTKEQVQVLCAE